MALKNSSTFAGTTLPPVIIKLMLSPKRLSRTSRKASFLKSGPSRGTSPIFSERARALSNFSRLPRPSMTRSACSRTFSQKSGTEKMCVTSWRRMVLTIVCGARSFRWTNARPKKPNQI